MKITFQKDTLYLAAIHDKFKCKYPTPFLPLYEIQNYSIFSASNSEPVICFQAYGLQAVNRMHNRLCCCKNPPFYLLKIFVVAVNKGFACYFSPTMQPANPTTFPRKLVKKHFG